MDNLIERLYTLVSTIEKEKTIEYELDSEKENQKKLIDELEEERAHIHARFPSLPRIPESEHSH